MDELHEFEKLENALVRAGREFEYPATPALAARVRTELTRNTVTRQPSRPWLRVLVPAAAALIFALALLFSFPDAREAVAQFLGLRGLRIFYVTPTPTPTSPSIPTSPPIPLPSLRSGQALQGEGSSTPRSNVTPSATLRPTPTRTVQPFALCCEMTLDEAQARARFKLLLPPDEKPMRVYYQNLYNSGDQVVMLFGSPTNPRFTLYQAQRWVYGKLLSGGDATLLAETQVHGVRALWFSDASHIVMVLDANGAPIYETARAVDANTLVWETGSDVDGIIYRLETKASLNEAIRFAESLQ
ncbi:MAG: hypothetical protein HY741_02055 [Chloroflexi bacterium]|nr:hypothetical protein [Chloroflexota bacterium]